MSDAEALLRAILSAPDDDAPRLIYADWLDERGEADRAAFIRLQIELAGLDPKDPLRPRLVQVERTLWRANRAAWTAWVPTWVQFTGFRRGFLESVRCQAADFLAGADELRRRTPLVAVRLDDVSELIVPLVRGRCLEGLQSLHLSTGTLADDHWDHVRDCPYLTGLDQLEISGSGEPGPLVDALVRSTGLIRLTRLRLPWCNIGDEATARLAAAPWGARLRRLDLSDNHIASDGALALARSNHLDGLEFLSLYHNPIPAFGGAIEALKRRFGDRVVL